MTTGRFGLDSAVSAASSRATRPTRRSRDSRSPTTFEAAAATDLVIEAVPERLDLKIKVFRDLDRAAPPATILASNTSGLPDRRDGGGHRPTRPRDRLALGVARAGHEARRDRRHARDESGDDRDRDRRSRRECGKHPIVVKDNPMAWGFVANRVYFAMVREAQRVVDEGIATRDEVDQLMMDCFRWPSGPFGMVKGAGSGWS